MVLPCSCEENNDTHFVRHWLYATIIRQWLDSQNSTHVLQRGNLPINMANEETLRARDAPLADGTNLLVNGLHWSLCSVT